MTPVLAGIGWVTPLGTEPEGVWQRLMGGERGEVKMLANPETGRQHPYLPVPPKSVEHLGRQPRLRRASPISYYAVGAALGALADAGQTTEIGKQSRVAVILAVSSGSVVYSRKFYEQIHKTGANTASPALFPETVYNAPASHLAAQLGIDGITYTLVGDTSIGLAAVKLAQQLLSMDTVDHALVIGAEELDWILCEGYRDWRFAAAQADTPVYGKPARGALLAEGGAAILLSQRGDGLRLTAVHDALAYTSRREARSAMRSIVAELSANRRIDAVVGSANGSSYDELEANAIEQHAPDASVICPKTAFGEALGAGALLQVAVAAMALRKAELPPVVRAGELAPGEIVRKAMRDCGWMQTAMVVTTGLNQQASGAVLVRG